MPTRNRLSNVYRVEVTPRSELRSKSGRPCSHTTLCAGNVPVENAIPGRSNGGPSARALPIMHARITSVARVVPAGTVNCHRPHERRPFTTPSADSGRFNHVNQGLVPGSAFAIAL